jgi:moderate conductance mechanosensitive channel
VIDSVRDFLNRQDIRDDVGRIVEASLRIVLIVVLALLVRAGVRRMIKRITRSSAENDLPLLLRPLGERLDLEGFLQNAGLLSERRRQRAETIGSVLRNLASVAIFALAGMLVLGELEINLAPIVASAGVVGVAFGFGAQNLVRDFVSGIFMILEDQYGVGDVIDLGEVSGTVEAVGLRTTRVRDEFGTVWYVRNGEVTRVGNQSQGYAQVVLDTPVAATEDLDRAGRVIKEAADSLWRDEAWSDVVIEEPQFLGIERLTEAGLVLRLTVKTRPLQQWRVGRELRRRVKVRLDDDLDGNVDAGDDVSSST